MAFFQTARTELPGKEFPDLTKRERQVLDLIARGRDNRAIAQLLGISSKTARNHVSNILSKLNVANRMQAALKAREVGFGSPAADDWI